jgi:non-homologous end joining protein Ku
MEQVKSASLKTTLTLAGLETPVALYKTTASSTKARKWDSAGPHGGELMAEARPAVVATASNPDAKADPIGSDSAASATEAAPPAAPTPKLIEKGHGEISADEVRKGIRLEGGKFIDLTEHLKQAAEDSARDSMEIVDFIAVGAVPLERVQGSYYLAGDTPQEGMTMPGAMLHTIALAMRASRRVAVVRWTKAGKGQSLGVLKVTGRDDRLALIVVELAWADHFRAPNDRCHAFNEVEVDADAVAQAVSLIETMAAKPKTLNDHVDPRAALEAELVERAESGQLAEFEGAPDPVGEDIGTLLEQLEGALAVR